MIHRLHGLILFTTQKEKLEAYFLFSISFKIQTSLLLKCFKQMIFQFSPFPVPSMNQQTKEETLPR